MPRGLVTGDRVRELVANQMANNITQDPRLLVSLSIHMGLKNHRSPHVLDILSEIIKKTLDDLDCVHPVTKLDKAPPRRVPQQR